MRLGDLPTPALVADRSAFDRNVGVMGAAWPGAALRTHVKAFKSTSVARRLAEAGHAGFCCATADEVVGMAHAGLGDDLLLANEVVDPRRLRAMAEAPGRVTVAVDSAETVEAAAKAGITEVLIDVNVGLPRCGCAPDDAEQLADRARAAGLTVRGVMGYEGHVVGVADRERRERETASSMAVLSAAAEVVGGTVVSGGGTGTWDLNPWVTELQAGSFTFMDTSYATLGLPFVPALAIVGTVISVNRPGGFAVADVGLKCLGMDHGDPRVEGATVWFCSDEHLTFGPPQGADGAAWPTQVGDRVLVWPAHIDPTISQHRSILVVDEPLLLDGAVPNVDAQIVDAWDVDLRGWHRTGA